jgi:amidase
MKIRVGFWYFLVVLTIAGGSLSAQTTAASSAKNGSQRAIDHDLFEVTIPQLEELYRSHKYTVTQVVQWYIARIAKYNGIYRGPDSGREGCSRHGG